MKTKNIVNCFFIKYETFPGKADKKELLFSGRLNIDEAIHWIPAKFDSLRFKDFSQESIVQIDCPEFSWLLPIKNEKAFIKRVSHRIFITGDRPSITQLRKACLDKQRRDALDNADNIDVEMDEFDIDDALKQLKKLNA